MLHYIQLGAALIGMLISLYLLIQHTRVKSGIQGSASFCTLGQNFNCDIVNSSRYSEVFGIPTAAFGALYFFLLALMALLAGPADKKFQRTQWVMAWLSLVALIIDLGLAVVQATVLHNFCLMCCLTYLATMVVLWTNYKMTPTAGGAGTGARFLRMLSGSRMKSGGRYPVGTLALSGFITLVFIGFLSMVPYFVRSGSPTNEKVEDALAQSLEAWKKMQVKPIEVKQEDATFGNPAAHVRVVVFSDFQCPFCKKGAYTLNTALEPLKDHIFFVFKNYPLDPKCNPALKYTLHAHACQLARLGYCAERKGLFWTYHDRVFFNLTEADLDKGDENLQREVKDVFTPEEFKACLLNPKALENVQEDVKLGNAMGIKGTPTVYINGKLVTIPLTVENLQKLVSLEEQSGS